MFRYGKKTAITFLILYLVNVFVIFAFSLMSGNFSGKFSSFFYDVLSKIRYGSAVNEETQFVKIDSLRLVLTGDTYAAGTRTQVFVDRILPENYTEFYYVLTSDEEKAEWDGTYLYFKSEGTVDVWAETESGVTSEVYTITVLKELDEDFVVDNEKFEIVLPDEMSLHDACGINYTYDGLPLRFKTTFRLSGDCAEIVEDRFIKTISPGEFTFEVLYEDAVVCSKTITVTSNVLPHPSFEAIYFDNRLIGEDIVELSYKSVYDATVKFLSEDSCQLFYMRTNFASLLYNFSPDKTKVKALADKLDYDTVYVYSPLDASTPLYSFSVHVVPPKPTVVGMNITEKCTTGTACNCQPKFADELSANGITMEIEGGEVAIDYEYLDSFSVKFKSEGLYRIIYTSEYYPDFQYVFNVLVEDANKASIARKTYGHAGLFVVLGVFAVFAFGYFAKKPVYKSIIIALSGIVVAAMSEVLQLPFFTQGRGSTVKDVFIDLGGFAIGVAVIMLIFTVIYLVNRKAPTPQPETAEAEDNLEASDKTEE